MQSPSPLPPPKRSWSQTSSLCVSLLQQWGTPTEYLFIDKQARINSALNSLNCFFHIVWVDIFIFRHLTHYACNSLIPHMLKEKFLCLMSYVLCFSDHISQFFTNFSHSDSLTFQVWCLIIPIFWIFLEPTYVFHKLSGLLFPNMNVLFL